MGALERGNIKARLRMTTLYSLNWINKCLVMNTCNLSETLTGNETKYGDAAGDLGLLNAYTKTELFMMARAVGFDKAFPEVYNKVPTPDLEEGNPNHTDEGIMGVTYLTLDMSIKGVTLNLVSAEDRDHIDHMVDTSAHKRHPMKAFDPNEEEW